MHMNTPLAVIFLLVAGGSSRVAAAPVIFGSIPVNVHNPFADQLNSFIASLGGGSNYNAYIQSFWRRH